MVTQARANSTVTAVTFASSLPIVSELPIINIRFSQSGHIVQPEQRQSARKVVRTRIALAMDGRAPAMGKTTDVGANGVSVNLPDPLPAGLAGQVGFDLLVDGAFVPIQARAKVMYCIFSGGELKVGFQFLNLELAAVTALARFTR
jgi:hypothetical protein